MRDIEFIFQFLQQFFFYFSLLFSVEQNARKMVKKLVAVQAFKVNIMVCLMFLLPVMYCCNFQLDFTIGTINMLF